MTFEHLYYNIFDYPLYVGLCLLLMLIYSGIYMLLAVYVERINPGEFGIAQPWYFLFTKAYWKPTSTNSTVKPSDKEEAPAITDNQWLEMKPAGSHTAPVMRIDRLNKVKMCFSARMDSVPPLLPSEIWQILCGDGSLLGFQCGRSLCLVGPQRCGKNHDDLHARW